MVLLYWLTSLHTGPFMKRQFGATVQEGAGRIANRVSRAFLSLPPEPCAADPVFVPEQKETGGRDVFS